MANDILQGLLGAIGGAFTGGGRAAAEMAALRQRQQEAQQMAALRALEAASRGNRAPAPRTPMVETVVRNGKPMRVAFSPDDLRELGVLGETMASAPREAPSLSQIEAEAAARARGTAAGRPAPVASAQEPPKPPMASEGERKIAGFLERARQANDLITDTPISEADLIASELPVARGALSERSRQQLQAVRQFASALLRKDTGASISKQEMAETMATYFPMPGDDAGTIDRKRKARATAIREFEIGAGRALPPAQPAPAMSERERRFQASQGRTP